MSNNDVRIPKPGEGALKSKLNLVGWIVGVGAVAVALAVYFVASGTMHASRTVVTGYPVVIVKSTDGASRAQEFSDSKEGFTRIIRVTDAKEFEGSTIEVRDSQVLDVVGDRIFTVGPSRDESLLVRLDDPTDHEVWVKPGQQVNILGHLVNMPAASERRAWGLKPNEEDLVAKRATYLSADSIDVSPASPERRSGG